jgi:hypothetical protein
VRPKPIPTGPGSITDATEVPGGELPTADPPAPPAADHFARIAALTLLVFLVGFSVLVEFRVATARKRRIDLDVNLRAAWAVRAGESPYAVTNERGWHYNLPPLLAILLVPLAEPPPEEPHPGTVPILAALAIWNIVGLLALAASVNALARAVEQGACHTGKSPRRLWAVRVLPVAACLPAIGITLNRGQLNLLLVALLCATAAAAVRGQRFRAGLWLAGAICLKILPAFLLLYPIWKRDLRWLAGCATGLAVGLGVIPAAAFGPVRAVEHYRELGSSVLLPGLNLGGDRTRAVELIELRASNSQSFQVLIYNLFLQDGPDRPTRVPVGLRVTHWLIALALTFVTLHAARRTADSSSQMVIRFGALALLMVPVSPASHDHYFCMNLVLVLGLVAAATCGEGVRLRGLWLALLLVGYTAACALPMLPELRILRDIRLPLIGSLMLWLGGILTLYDQQNAPCPGRLPNEEMDAATEPHPAAA